MAKKRNTPDPAMGLRIGELMQASAHFKTQDALANKVGCHQTTIQRIVEGITTPQSDTLGRIAAALGSTVEFLQSGVVKSGGRLSDATPLSLGSSRLPLVDIREVAAWNQPQSGVRAKKNHKMISCPWDHGPAAFAMRVQGDPMLNPHGPRSYSDGDVIYVDPSLKATHGCRVVVKLPGQDEVLFRELQIEAGVTRLKALNPSWVPQYVVPPTGYEVIGVVIGKSVAD